MLPGFDANTVPPNDDGSTAEIDLGFAISFFGIAADSVFVNNNGNVTIGAPLPNYTPFSLNSTSVRILAPFFADVDTRTNGGSVTYGPGTVNGRPAFGVTWRDVDFYNSATVDHPARNRFQLIIIERSDTGANNFDFWFNYDRIAWETGQASGGNANGLGGSSARVGYANGSGIFYEQAGSAVNGALLDSNLATGLTHNRLNSDRDARYVFEVRNSVVVPPTAAFRRFLAEGATGTFFDTRIALFNANAQAVTATLRFLRSDGQVFPVQVAMPARSRRTVDPETVAGLEARDFSIVVESNAPLIVDRTMTWGAGGYGSHAETSVDAPVPVWYLAEGSTSADFSLFYLLQNPNPTAVTATIDFLLPPGQAPLQRTYTLRPNSRLTIAVDEIPEVASTDLSAVITASAPIIVERAMYMSHPGQPFSAGHESAGVVAPARAWFLAEGATGPFFDMFILMANPSTSAAEVEARYLTSTGTVLPEALHAGGTEPHDDLGGRRAVRPPGPGPRECRGLHDADRPAGPADYRRADDVVARSGNEHELLDRSAQLTGSDCDRHVVGARGGGNGRRERTRDLHPRRQYVGDAGVRPRDAVFRGRNHGGGRFQRCR